MVRFLTSGESHGPGLVVIIEGLPARISVDLGFIRGEMKRRMLGYGRGGRMKIEKDNPRILSGIRMGRTLGTPVAILIENLDYPNWEEIMAPFGEEIPGEKRVVHPRPGHADLPGVLKRGFKDVRDVLERASARETAARVAAGSLAKLMLSNFDIEVASYVVCVGNVKSRKATSFDEVKEADPDRDPLRMLDGERSKRARAHIDDAAERGDSVGGSFEVICRGVPPGLGDYTQWDRRLDGKLGAALLSIPAIRAVEIGEGVKSAASGGKKAHDEIFPGEGNVYLFGRFRAPFRRKTNRAGGLEGGMTNGEELRVTCHMKPIPTLTSPLGTVNIDEYESARAVKERSDVCAVPAASIVGEAMVALVLAGVMKEKFGGDTIDDMVEGYSIYLERICRGRERG